MRKLVGDYEESAKRVELFMRDFKSRWLLDNKPYGWEIQQARLGGLYFRILDCRDRLVEYLDGKATNIPELEEELLPYQPAWGLNYNRWRGLISVGTI